MYQLQKLTVFLLIVFTSCSGTGEFSESNRMSVLVTVIPQRYFVEKIAGDLVDVTILIPPGANPAAYELSPSDMRHISGAAVWFTVGLQRENSWIASLTSLNESMRVVNSVERIQRLPIGRYDIPGEELLMETEASSHGHDPTETDPHVWLSPELVRSQASIVCETLTAVDPENAVLYAGNLSLFLGEIDSLQSEIHALLDPHRGERFMVFHPAWGYFADEYGLIQVPIEVSGSEPSPAEMGRLMDFGTRDSLAAVFVSPQFSQSSAETIAGELGARVIVIDPLAENWAENILFVAGELALAMEKQ